MKSRLYVIRVDVAYNANFIVIPHTNRQKALQDYDKRIKNWGKEWGEEGKFLKDFDHEKEYEYRDLKSGEGATFYFNAVTSGDELIL